MAKKNRRRGGRVNSAPPDPLTQLLRQVHQAHGALGIVRSIAQFAARCQDDGEKSLVDRGHAFVRVMSNERSKLGAAALAATAEIWPDEEVRVAAGSALAARRSQLSGALRDLTHTSVADVWRLTDEYRDSSVLLIELSIGGRLTATLAAASDRFCRSSVEFTLCSVGAEEAAGHFHFEPSPGDPRRILEPVSTEDARFEAWMLNSYCHIEGDPGDAIFFKWVARLLDVDVQFPHVPRFDRRPDDDEERPDAISELDVFLSGTPGRAWSAEPFAGLIDYLESQEWGDGALRWSPARVERFLFSPELFEVDGTVHAMPALLRGWVTHCASVMGQRKPLLRAVLEEIDRCEPEFLADVAA